MNAFTYFHIGIWKFSTQKTKAKSTIHMYICIILKRRKKKTKKHFIHICAKEIFLLEQFHPDKMIFLSTYLYSSFFSNIVKYLVPRKKGIKGFGRKSLTEDSTGYPIFIVWAFPKPKKMRLKMQKCKYSECANNP